MLHRKTMIARLSSVAVIALAPFIFMGQAGAQNAQPYGQPSTTKGDWPMYFADPTGSRYLPFDQINASNFNKLEVAWHFKTDALGAKPEYKLEGTPIEVNGTVYTTAGSRRDVVALDARTGELKWVYSLNEGLRASAFAPRQLSGRGVSYWTDGNGGERDVPGGDTSTNTGAAAALNGIQFGANGVPLTYVLGNCDFYAVTNSAPYIATTVSKSVSFCPGGTASQKQSGADLGIMSFPLQQATGFFYGTYKLTPDIVAHLMLNYGFNHGLGSSLIIDASESIKSDNAFLPASVAAQMAALKVTSVTVSTAGFNTSRCQAPHPARIPRA